ncbi:MAG: TolC family protein [Deltaproteobacteria bacterium]|nr:TolC family protein [Deltaproteobacteria bacterium]
MRRVIPTLFLLLGAGLALVFTAAASPAAAAASPPLQLAPLLEEALRNRPALRAARLEAVAKEAEIGPRGAYEDPMVGFTAMNYPTDTFSAGEFGMTANEISLSQKIPFPGKLTKQRAATRYEHQSKTQDYHQRKLELVKEVKVVFYELFLAYKKRDILNEQIAILDQLISVTRSKYTLGKVIQAELLGLQAEEGNFRDQLFTAEKQIRSKTAELARAVGRESADGFGRPEEFRKTPLNFGKITERGLSDRALANSPALKSARAGLDATQEKLSFARWSYLPDFEFRMAYAQRQPSPGDRGVALVSGGVALSIPLWAFSKQSEEVRGAVAGKTRAEALVDEEQNALIQKVHVMYSELEEASKRLNLFEGGLVPLARQAVFASKSAYLSGKMDYGALSSLLRTRFQTEFAYNEALANYESRIAELEALLGEPLGEPR